MRYSTIHIQGNLISEEILHKIESGQASGQSDKDFGIDRGGSLRQDIDHAWSRIRLDWKYHKDRMDNIPESDPYGTAISMRWMECFLSALGFDLSRQRANLTGDNNQSYPISHIAENLDSIPIHITGFTTRSRYENKNTLDIKSREGTSRHSPQGLVQEFLNVTDHVYGLVTNGIYLRLIRDSGRLVKQSYLEVDIKRLLEEDKYSEFVVLYRLLHASRFPKTKGDAQHAWLDNYYKESIETGNRIREGLSAAVKVSLLALGNGFLRHAENENLRDRIQSGQLTNKDYYRQLLRIIYRLLFLMVSEDRDLIHEDVEASPDTIKKKKLYYDYYSITRLRRLSQQRYLYEGHYDDLWAGLVNTFRLFDVGSTGIKMNINPLGGDLFNLDFIRDILHSTISNELLLDCIRNLHEFEDEQRNRVQINYRSLDVEELGSVYEGLLELHPVIQHLQSESPSHIVFTFHEGTDRKTTGSYYTRPELVNELIKSALIPVIEDRLKKTEGRENRIKALLQLKVCDPAAGSGHMMLAAARTIAWYLARIDSEEENPAPSVYRKCLREVIQHCIHAVDMNPDAVELCKLAFWIEGHNSGKPLSFLDHKILNGNSLVGVTDLSVLSRPLPDDAYNPVTGDNKDVCRELKKRNAAFRKSPQTNLFASFGESIRIDTSSSVKAINEIEWTSQDTLEGIEAIRNRFEKLRANQYHEELACHIWTSAFFKTYTHLDDNTNPTSERLIQFFTSPSQYGQLVGEATKLAYEYKFFHWPLAFPDVYSQGGFDVMLGNPPWERIKLQQEEYFSTRDASIANAPNAAARNRMIAALQTTNPALYNEYESALHGADATGKFLRESGRYELTATGDINTYSVFSELFSRQVNDSGRAGFIVPTGIATDDSNKRFFGDVVEKNKLISLFDFENREKIFRDVDSRYKFCLLTLAGSNLGEIKSQFGFFLTNIEHLQDPLRIFSLSREDFLRLNPNTKTCPIFRTAVDASLTTSIYNRVKILLDEISNKNIWNINLTRLFDMANDSNLFKDINDFDLKFKNLGSSYITGNDKFIPLYESKYFHQYNHRWSDSGPNEIDQKSPYSLVTPRYWVNSNFVSERIGDKWNRRWFIGFRKIGRANDERTFISTIIPYYALSDSGILVLSGERNILNLLGLVANFNSLVFDYVVRQKLGGTNMAYFIVNQLPILGPNYTENSSYFSITNNVFQLLYTSWDMHSLADDIWKESSLELRDSYKKLWEENKFITGGHDLDSPNWIEIDSEGCPLPPFKWNEDRRAIIRAELDAIYAHLYGLTTNELRYILDPQDVYGEDFPGETFRVLKEKEIRQYGEYRTRRLVLEAWERMGYGN